MLSAEDAKDIFLNNYLHAVGVAILYYDYVVTFSDEVANIWRRPKSTSSWWFFANRYMAISGYALAFYSLFATNVTGSCHAWSWYRQIIMMGNSVLIGVLMFLRVFALYNRDIRVFIGCFIFALILLAVCGWSLVDQTDVVNVDDGGCHVGISEETGYHVVASWEALLAYDTLIFILTLAKSCTGYNWRHVFRSGPGVPLSTLVFRDGAIYYAVMGTANLGNILTFYYSGPQLKGGLSLFSTAIASTMMSRIILNMHNSAELLGEDTDRPPSTTLAMDNACFTSHIATAAPVSPDRMTFDFMNSPYDTQLSTVSSPPAWSPRSQEISRC